MIDFFALFSGKTDLHTARALAERLYEAPAPPFAPTPVCWLDRRVFDRTGYGTYSRSIDGIACGGTHRVVYVLLVGFPPKGKVLGHLCLVRACANPEHLEPVSQLVNFERGLLGLSIARHARRQGATCPRGHFYSEHGRKYARAFQCVHPDCTRSAAARSRARYADGSKSVTKASWRQR